MYKNIKLQHGDMLDEYIQRDNISMELFNKAVEYNRRDIVLYLINENFILEDLLCKSCITHNNMEMFNESII